MEGDENKTSPENSHSGTPPPTPPTLSDTVSSAMSSSLIPLRSQILEQGGGSQEAAEKKRKKGELSDPPSTEPRCATCGKTFGSWKAVFGHLRSHPERHYRGAFPPPMAGGNGGVEMGRRQQELLASTLLSVARDVSSKMVAGTERATTVFGSSSGRGLGIDLNDPREPLESPSERDEFRFDLNMPAQAESDQDEDNEDH